MADEKISELTAATSFLSTDLFPVVSGAETKKVTAAALAAGLASEVGGTSANIGYFDVSSVAAVADAGSDDVVVDLSTLGNGMYIFTVNAIAVDETGNIYVSSFGFRAIRNAGTLAGSGLASPVYIPTVNAETEPTQTAFTFSNASGNLNINFANTIGNGELMSAIVCTSLIYIPVPAAPE